MPGSDSDSSLSDIGEPTTPDATALSLEQSINDDGQVATADLVGNPEAIVGDISIAVLSKSPSEESVEHTYENQPPHPPPPSLGSWQFSGSAQYEHAAPLCSPIPMLRKVVDVVEAVIPLGSRTSDEVIVMTREELRRQQMAASKSAVAFELEELHKKGLLSVRATMLDVALGRSGNTHISSVAKERLTGSDRRAKVCPQADNASVNANLSKLVSDYFLRLPIFLDRVEMDKESAGYRRTPLVPLQATVPHATDPLLALATRFPPQDDPLAPTLEVAPSTLGKPSSRRDKILKIMRRNVLDPSEPERQLC